MVQRLHRMLSHALRNPRYTVGRIGLLAYELTHPGEPWIAAGAVRFCEKNLHPSARALEWGSGRSTLWFAQRVAQLTSIEHDRAWYEQTKITLQSNPKVDYRLIELQHSPSEPTLRSYEPQPRYVAVAAEFEDESLDLVVVDGHYRQACVRAALRKLKSGSLLLVDNWNRMDQAEWGVPHSFTLAHLSSNVMTQTAIWRKP